MSEHPAPTSPGRGSLAVIFLTVFIDLLGFAMVLPLLPVYAKKFNADESGWMIGLLMASFSIMQFLFAPLWGRFSDRVGRRPVLLVGLAGAAVFYAVFGVATMLHSIAWLFASRIGAGIACATIPVAQAYIADTTTLETRAKGMALIGAAFGVGFCLGPLIGAAAILLSPGGAGASPWPGFAAAILSSLAFLLALVRLPESLRPDSQSAARNVFDTGAWGAALSTPTVPALLLTSFVSVLSFGGFETTLALLLKDKEGSSAATSLFHFSDWGVLLFFSYIGVVLSIAQGGIVRRLAGKVSEGVLATVGAVFSMSGFGLLVLSVQLKNYPLLMIASGIEVMGFAFMTPTLQALVSRRSDPARQGSIAGVSQSVSALARIAGPLVALPLFAKQPSLPYVVSACLMVAGLVLMQFAVRGGRDYGATESSGGMGH
jgi:MFS family permease